MYQFNRWYLLGSILMAFVIPAFSITVEATKTTEMPISFQETEFISDISPVLEPQAQPIPYESYLLAIYLGISLMLLIYFCYNIYKLFVKINKSEKASYFEATVILLKEKVQPHSFLKYIFINKKVYKKDQQEQLILTHELAHVQQKHSIDIVLLELLNMLFWFVPIFKLYKKAIQLNHEFLADQAVLKTHNNISEYQNLLLKLTTQNNNTYLASNLNYSLTKKRLLMMTTPSSKTKILLKKVLLFPVVAGFIFAFAQRVEAKQNEKPKEKEIKKLTTDPTEEELYRDYSHKNVLLKYTDKNGNKIEKSYFEMTPEEKKMLGNPMPLLFKKKIPSEKIISDLKNSEKYAIWIDEKVVDNSVLETYTNSDFSSYSISFVYKNARSERFPQEYQAHLTTNDFFETRNNKRVRDFEDYKEKRKKDPNYRGETSKKQPMIFFKEPLETKKEKKASKTKTGYAGKVKKAQEKITFHKNWFITIDGQKYQYTFDKDERIARYYINGELVNLDIIKEYTKKHKIFEGLKNSGKHYVFKTEEERKLIDQEFSDLGGMYFRMQQVDKSKVPYPKNPIGEYIKLERNDGSYYFKKRSELTNEDRKLLKVRMPPPAMDTIFTYNYFVKKIQAAPKTGKAYMIRIKQMYKEMTPKQREQVIEPSLVLPQPEVINVKNNKSSNIPKKSAQKIDLKDYIAKFKVYEVLTHKKPHFVQKTTKEKKVISDLWIELRKQYRFSLSKEDKSKVDLPTSPYLPYVKILLNGKSYYKLYNQLSENEAKSIPNIPMSNAIEKTLSLLDKNDPIEIPIGTFKLTKRVADTKLNKQSIVIAISPEGEFLICKDNSYKKFEKISLSYVETFLSNLSTNEIKNTFVFSRSKDLNKFRSKPANSKEYQDDIKISLIKNDVRFPIIKVSDNTYRELISTQFILDNKGAELVKPHVQKLADIFKKYGITNMTI